MPLDHLTPLPVQVVGRKELSGSQRTLSISACLARRIGDEGSNAVVFDIAGRQWAFCRYAVLLELLEASQAQRRSA